MNKNGFTLVELLASITILGILMVLVVPNITSSTNNVKERNYINLKNTIIQSTINYILVADNESYSLDVIKPAGDDCSSGCHMCISVGDLIDNNVYYSNERNSAGELTVINPITNKGMRNERVIIWYDTDTYSLNGVFEEDNDDNSKRCIS